MIPTRRSIARSTRALQMQQQALVQLIVASVVVFGVILAAAFFTVAPLGSRSPRAVAPVIGSFMRAGAEGNALQGHAQLSTEGLRAYDVRDVAALYAQRNLFDGFERLQVRSMRITPPSGPSRPETAEVEATVRYEAFEPAMLRATLALEDGHWRISRVRISRGE